MMSQKRVKWIRNLIRNKDSNLLITVRNYCGEKTETMNSKEIYREARKLWRLKVRETKKWGIKK